MCAVLRGAGRGGLGPLRAPDLLPLLRADAGALRRPILRCVPGGAAAGEAGPGAGGASGRPGQLRGAGRTGKVLGGSGGDGRLGLSARCPAAGSAATARASGKLNVEKMEFRVKVDGVKSAG